MSFREVPITTLLTACSEGDTQEAWEEFQRRFHKVIAVTVLRVSRTFGNAAPELLDDLIQETYLKLCAERGRLLREARSETPESLAALLKSVAHSVAMDHFRGTLAQKRGGGLEDRSLEVVQEPAGDRHAPASLDRGVLLSQVDACIEKYDQPDTVGRDRMIFWLYYRTGLTSRAIAAMPAVGLTQKGVESVLQRMTRFVRGRLGPSGAAEGKAVGNSS